MEGLFQFFAESPFILFIIIAALLGFFRSGNAGKEQQQRQPQRGQQGQQRSAPDKQEQKIDWKEIFQQESRPTEPQPTASRSQDMAEETSSNEVSLSRQTDAEIHNASTELQERYEKLQERQEQAKRRTASLDNSPYARKDNIQKTKPKVQLDFSNISRDEAVKGVVWAEILGKPKGFRR